MLQFIRIWIKLLKPRVSTLVLVTALPGLYLGADKTPSAVFVFHVLFGTFLMSSASFMLNQYIEVDRDSKMERTKNRPLPRGDVSPLTALIAAVIFTVVSFGYLNYFANLLTALCAFSALLFYVFVYTIYLKPRTDQNIVIGGVAGCIGPLIGYAASSNSLPLPGWVLFMMIFLWTPPHFWALAIFLKDDYSSANFPMMPVLRGVEETTKQIFYYTIVYAASCIGFYFTTDKVGHFYLWTTVALCLWMLYYAWKLMQTHSEKQAKSFFFLSIFHLFLVNIAILVDFAFIQ